MIATFTPVPVVAGRLPRVGVGRRARPRRPRLGGGQRRPHVGDRPLCRERVERARRHERLGRARRHRRPSRRPHHRRPRPRRPRGRDATRRRPARGCPRRRGSARGRPRARPSRRASERSSRPARAASRDPADRRAGSPAAARGRPRAGPARARYHGGDGRDRRQDEESRVQRPRLSAGKAKVSHDATTRSSADPPLRPGPAAHSDGLIPAPHRFAHAGISDSNERDAPLMRQGEFLRARKKKRPSAAEGRFFFRPRVRA